MYRDTWMEVDLDAIASNFREIKRICGKKMIAVLKADAYGSGDIYVADTVLEAGAEMIAVSSLDEALIFRNEGYTGEILILGAVPAQFIPTLIRHNISVNAYSRKWAEEAAAKGCAGLKVHLKVDTGMNRLGFKECSELKEGFDILQKAGCRMEGIFTHFCCADTDPQLTQTQFERFREAVKYLAYDFPWIHCDNSDATIWFKDDLSNACRLGISMYGISGYKKDLQHPLSLWSKISMVKTVRKGETIGYGATYTADCDQIIATLPIGYADGFIRANQGRKVYAGGQYAEIVGRVCMDQCMIRLDSFLPEGTEAEIFGPHISLEDMAEDLHTIPYEIICLISSRVTRKYIRDGKKYDEENTRMVRSRINK